MGRDKLDRINGLGASRLSEALPMQMGMPAPPPTVTTNVWAVTPDQVPPPAPNDIVHHIVTDIQRGGQMKTLIKQVQREEVKAACSLQSCAEIAFSIV